MCQTLCFYADTNCAAQKPTNTQMFSTNFACTKQQPWTWLISLSFSLTAAQPRLFMLSSAEVTAPAPSSAMHLLHSISIRIAAGERAWLPLQDTPGHSMLFICVINPGDTLVWLWDTSLCYMPQLYDGVSASPCNTRKSSLLNLFSHTSCSYARFEAMSSPSGPLAAASGWQIPNWQQSSETESGFMLLSWVDCKKKEACIQIYLTYGKQTHKRSQRNTWWNTSLETPFLPIPGDAINTSTSHQPHFHPAYRGVEICQV